MMQCSYLYIPEYILNVEKFDSQGRVPKWPHPVARCKQKSIHRWGFSSSTALYLIQILVPVLQYTVLGGLRGYFYRAKVGWLK